MNSGQNKMSLFYIPASLPFAETLAGDLFARYGDTVTGMGRVTLLLPTRRAARTLREAFLRRTEGRPLLLPRMGSIGDLDAEDIALQGGAAGEDLSLPPAMPGLQRQFILSRLIEALPAHQQAGTAGNFELAGALGRLMDQVYTEDLNLAHLPEIAGAKEFAEHWNITVRFLEILSVTWPRILAERGMIDAADRRNRLIKAQADLWRHTPPSNPVIAAGSTGSIPATRELLSVVAGLPAGEVILPGLDPAITDSVWDAIDETHPQGTLKSLLADLKVPRTAVRPLTHTDKNASLRPSRTHLIHEVMRPSGTTEDWENLKDNPAIKKEYEAALSGIHRYDVKTRQDEAAVIAAIFRETLNTPGKTAALVTPDRQLARRVASLCERWGIGLDDSAGMPLSQTSIGTFLTLALDVAQRPDSVLPFLSFLRHSLNQIGAEFSDSIDRLDRDYLRGLPLSGGWKAVRSQIRSRTDAASSEILTLLQRVEDIILESRCTVPETKTVGEWCRVHIHLAECFCPSDRLWAGEDGEAAAQILSQAITYGDDLPPLNAAEYADLFKVWLKSANVRPIYGTHPRLIILGQLEARMYQADIMILSGLNEGTWPPAAPEDPFMSRPMRADFGLPPPERSIGLAAHDFVQAFHAPEVYLTRAERVDGAPTVPARWLMRLDTVLSVAGINPPSLHGTYHLSLAAAMDRPGTIVPAARPEPRPPVTARPTHLSVTQIETWLSNPYAIYARDVLKLKALKPLAQPMDAAARGTIIHKTVERWTAPGAPLTSDRFLTLAKEEIDRHDIPPGTWTFWAPRLGRIAAWLIPHETAWRQNWRPGAQEIKGTLILPCPDGRSFTLSARADRIDISPDGQSAALIDYKSAGSFAKSALADAWLPQLPLEAAILSSGGFAGWPARRIDYVGYWVIKGGSKPGEEIALTDSAVIQSAQEKAIATLTRLIDTFADENTPYYCLPRPSFVPRYDDYALLARVKEWAALDEEGNAAA